jgi:hypothetical protein
MIAKIAQIAEDTVFMTGMIGSKNSPRRLFAPNTMPRGSPISVASTNPVATRPSVMPRLCQRSPLAEIMASASNTRGGPGSTKCGIRSEMSHHTATMIRTSAKRCATRSGRNLRPGVRA